MPRKYSVEFKEKAVHQIIEMVRLESCSLQRAYTEVGKLLGVSHHTLRALYRDSASVRDDSDASGSETMEEELKRLRRENRESVFIGDVITQEDGGGGADALAQLGN